jgi:hypothetical protein
MFPAGGVPVSAEGVTGAEDIEVGSIGANGSTPLATGYRDCPSPEADGGVV